MLNNNQKQPGLNCPQCGTFIPTTIAELLSARSLRCPHCRLELTINRKESKRAMEILQKVDDAQKNLDNASKFKP
jgi:DNA-directed RNA polymerase subunit RPC12/RpoP